MRNTELFQALVDYHWQNLQACLPYIEGDGRVHVTGRPIEEGRENKFYPGVLLVANGDRLASRLMEDRVILDEAHEQEPAIEIATEADLHRYLSTHSDNDGAYVFDGVNSRIMRVNELNNDPPGLPRISLYDMIPKDFAFYDGVDRPNVSRPGVKTRLAARIPHAYPLTKTFQIKQSAYTPPRLGPGLGKVTHFDSDGLREEFFFMNSPDYRDSRTNPHGIVGVHRSYARRSDTLTRTAEAIMPARAA